MKKTIAIAFAAALVLALAACGGAKEAPEEPSTQIANPWVDCATLQEAADLAGFSMDVPDQIDGYPDTFIQAVEGQTIQVFYYDGDLGEEGSSRVLIRKTLGEGDTSGDSTAYAEEETVTVDGVEVTVSGENGLVHKAIWNQDGYSYSIGADKGLAQEDVEALVEQIQ